MQAADVIAALRHCHRPPEWVFFDELRAGTGYAADAEKRLDAWAIRCYKTALKRGQPTGHVRVAYEVKVSRSDWLRELKSHGLFGNRPKRDKALSLCNLFYFAVPAYMVKPIEVPEDSGLVYVHSDGSVEIVKDAPWRDAQPPSLSFLAAVARRALLTERGINGRGILEAVSP